jgi:subtilisin-like proprotein convertase family protein
MKRSNTLRLATAVFAAALLGLASNASAAMYTFPNTDPISIPGSGSSGQGDPYPSKILVAGITDEVVIDVNVTVNDVDHTFSDDIYIVLEGPTGQSLLLWNDAGGGANLFGIDITFDDQALAPIPDSASFTSGSYQVSQYDQPPGPADTAPAPYPGFGGSLADFNALDPNGTWNLFAYDDAGGDSGTAIGGWSISFDTRPIPEPSAALLFAVGSFVVGGTLRRRRA